MNCGISQKYIFLRKMIKTMVEKKDFQEKDRICK